MARSGARAYHSLMANVVLHPQMADPDALYVWAGITGPQWGSWAAFNAAKTSRIHFSNADWQVAIVAATADADRVGLSTVYVVRGA
jgi:hypothetical protein